MSKIKNIRRLVAGTWVPPPWSRLTGRDVKALRIIIITLLACVALIISEFALLAAWLITGDSACHTAWEVVYYLTWALYAVMIGQGAWFAVKYRRSRR